ncbi:MAG TPA: hypothetical protein PLZ61_06790, partial [Candidatus Cryosericum sp.]|nr:hypothetical protein [Candidatus Cryosericum sp.]
MRRFRPLLDALCLLAAFLLALLLRFRFETSSIDIGWYWASLGIFVAVDLGTLYLRGMYDDGYVANERTGTIVDGLVYATFLYLLVAYLIKNTLFSRLTLAYFLLFSFLLQLGLERLACALRRRRYVRGEGLVPALLVGDSADLDGLTQEAVQRDLGLRLLREGDVPLTVQSTGEVQEAVDRFHASAVLLVSPLEDGGELVGACLRRYVTIYALGGTVHSLPYPSDVLFVGTVPVLRVRDLLIVGVGARVKRLMDVVLAGAGVIILSPLLLVLALLVKGTSPGPVL